RGRTSAVTIEATRPGNSLTTGRVCGLTSTTDTGVGGAATAFLVASSLLQAVNERATHAHNAVRVTDIDKDMECPQVKLYEENSGHINQKQDKRDSIVFWMRKRFLNSAGGGTRTPYSNKHYRWRFQVRPSTA
ncbi:hypothetical protein, partial [Rhizobium sp. L245/93]|uniref:hypothetical protein n=1 Tax=Rhizobium sp. L245/93 TaxID=2819998 RepID=UPI001ADBA618